MAMFDNPRKDLEALEARLLEDEEWFERELTQAKALMGEEPVKKAKNTAPQSAGKKPAGKKTTPAQKVRASARKDQVLMDPPPYNNRGLLVLALIETLGIVMVVAYWLAFLL